MWFPPSGSLCSNGGDTQINNKENNSPIKVRVDFGDVENCVWTHYLDKVLRDGLSEEVTFQLRAEE